MRTKRCFELLALDQEKIPLDFLSLNPSFLGLNLGLKYRF